MEPAPYPAKNTEELKAVYTFVSLLDLNRVKPEANWLDKVPNHDGFIELVDEQQRPIGELKVQIKKVPDNSNQFDCPVELVAYSERVSSPFILVCVDVGNQKAYWRHISSVMAGLKSDQKTFTVKFQTIVDEIGTGFPYIERWHSLCVDYLNRVSEFPRLRRQIDEEIGLNKLKRQDCQDFQEFIDTVNILLDVDLPIVKLECFADTWKLGVAIHHVNEDEVSYSIYTIPLGGNMPLITHVPRAGTRPKFSIGDGAEIPGIIGFNLEGGVGNEISLQWATRSHFGNPVKAAREFVFRYLLRILRKKGLHVHGQHQSVELIMLFMRMYAHTLGLPKTDSYKTSDLAYGLSVFFPMWYSLAFPPTMEFFRRHFGDMLAHNPFPSFEQIANPSRQSHQPTEFKIREALRLRLRPTPHLIRTHEVSLKSLQQAIDFLRAAGIDEISRLDRPYSRVGNSVWDCYSQENIKHNITAMLQGAADDYPYFVKGNRFGRLNFPLISQEVAMICEIDTSKWCGSDFPPTGHEYRVQNLDRSLPLLTIIDLAEEPNRCIYDGETVMFRSQVRKCLSSRTFIFLNFGDKRFIQSLLYEWLRTDLENHYGKILLI